MCYKNKGNHWDLEKTCVSGRPKTVAFLKTFPFSNTLMLKM